MAADIQREISRVWAVADKDNSGYVEAAEVANLMAKLNGGKAITSSQLEKIMAVLDEDGDKRVSYKEFEHAMMDWLGAAAGSAVDAGEAAREGALTAAAAAVDAAYNNDNPEGSRVTTLGSASRRQAHNQIMQFFSTFTEESLDAAAYASVKDAARADLTSSSYPLISGPFGLFARMSPYAAVREGGDVSAEERVAALVRANEAADGLTALASQLTGSCTLQARLEAVRQLRTMLAVRDLFDSPSLRPAVRENIIAMYNSVGKLRIFEALLPFLHPGAAKAVGLAEAAFSVDTDGLIAAMMVAPQHSGVADPSAASTPGTKRRIPTGGFDDSDAFIVAKKRAISISTFPMEQPLSACLIPDALNTTVRLPTIVGEVDIETWNLLVLETALVMVYLCLGPRLPHTPPESFWHPANVFKGAKTLLIQGENNYSAIPWILFHIIYAADPTVRCGMAGLLAAIAAYNRECHYAVAVQHAGVFALLQRLVTDQESDAAKEVLSATLSVMCGATLPPDCLTVSGLMSSMCGTTLLNTLAMLLQTPAEPAQASDALRIRSHAATAFTYILPLLDLEATWPVARGVIDILAAAAQASFEALSSTLVASTSASSWVTRAIFGHPSTKMALAAQAAAAQVGGAAITTYEKSELFVTHTAILKQVLQCFRYLMIAGSTTAVPVPLSSLSTERASIVAARVGVDLSTDSELPAFVSNAVAAGADVNMTASAYIAAATGCMDIVGALLQQSTQFFDSSRSAALSFILTATVFGNEERIVTGTPGVLAGLVLCLTGTEEIRTRAASVLCAIVENVRHAQSLQACFENGFVGELARALASVKHSDDVLAEAYSDLQASFDFSFIRDAVKALGLLFTRAEELSPAVHMGAGALRASQFNLEVVAALHTAIKVVMIDAMRTLSLQMAKLTAVELRDAFTSLDNIRLLLRVPAAGIDPARAEADEAIRSLMGLIQNLHSTASTSGPSSRAIAAELDSQMKELVGYEEQVRQAGINIANGLVNGTAGGSAGLASFVTNAYVPVVAEVPADQGRPFGSSMRSFNIRRNDTWEYVRQIVREKYGEPTAEIAYLTPTGHVVPINSQGDLEKAHQEHASRSIHELHILVWFRTVGIPNGVGTRAAVAFGLAAGATGGAAAVTDIDMCGGASLSYWERSSRSNIPSFVDAVSGLVETYGRKILLEEQQMKVLYDRFAAKAAARGAENAELDYADFLSLLQAEGLIAADAPAEFSTQLFKLVDSDGSGYISWNEMAVGLVLLGKGGYEQKMDSVFAVFDRNNDNELDENELVELIAAATHLSRADCMAIARDMMYRYDIDGNGVLSLGEFKMAVACDTRLSSAFWQSAAQDWEYS